MTRLSLRDPRQGGAGGSHPHDRWPHGPTRGDAWPSRVGDWGPQSPDAGDSGGTPRLKGRESSRLGQKARLAPGWAGGHGHSVVRQARSRLGGCPTSNGFDDSWALGKILERPLTTQTDDAFGEALRLASRRVRALDPLRLVAGAAGAQVSAATPRAPRQPVETRRGPGRQVLPTYCIYTVTTQLFYGSYYTTYNTSGTWRKQYEQNSLLQIRRRKPPLWLHTALSSGTWLGAHLCYCPGRTAHAMSCRFVHFLLQHPPPDERRAVTARHAERTP